MSDDKRRLPDGDELDELDALDDDDWNDVDIADTYLTFHLAGSEYAIAVSNVKEIVRLPEFTEIPDMPEFIRGVINLRGHVIPLMDARARLGLPELEYSDRTIAIVLESEGVPTGIVADGVNGVVDIPPGQIDPPPQRKSRTGRAAAVTGIGRTEDAVSIILDASCLLGEDELESLAALQARASA